MTSQLSFTSQQINEAISGAFRSLLDPWGFTGNQKIVGESHADFFHGNSGAVGGRFSVTGESYAYGNVRHYAETFLNNLYLTGDAVISSITGETTIENIISQSLRLDTGYLPYTTGDSTHLGDSRITGDFYLNGGLNASGNSIISGDFIRLSGGALYLHGDSVSISCISTGDSVTFGSQASFAYPVSMSDNLSVTQNLTVGGEIFLSGNRLFDYLTLVTTNEIFATGDVLSAFTAKGDLLVGTGVSGAQTLPLGTHGQFLQVDTSNGTYGMKWVDSGILAGGGGGGSSLLLFEEKNIGNAGNNTIQFSPTTGNKHVGIGTNSGFFVGREGINPILGKYAISIQPFNTSVNCTGDYNVIVGNLNTLSSTGDYNFAFGHQNSIAGGNYNIALGYDNDFPADGLDYSLIGGYTNFTSGGRGDVILGMNNSMASTDIGVAVRNSHSILIGSGNSIIFEFTNNGKFNKSALIGLENTTTDSGSYIFGNNNSSVDQGVMLGNGGYLDRFSQFVKSAASDSHQSSEFIFGGSTTNASSTELFLGGQASERLTVPSNSTFAFEGITVARRTDGGGSESAAYKHEGVIKNDAGTTSAISISNTVIGEDASVWGAGFSADNTNDALIISVTGEVGKTIEWRTFIFSVEYRA